MPDRRAVLITRPEPGAGETAARITALGLQPVVAPLLMIVRRHATLPPSARVQAILATSRNAISALPASHLHLPLFAVGAATARHAKAAGFEQVTSADADAEALAALLSRSCDREADPLLLVTGQNQGNTLANDLRARGFQVIRRAVYATIPATILPEPANRAFTTGTLSAALFFSAETASTCVRLLQAAGLDQSVTPVAALAIGQSTGVALQTLPWRRIRVAAQPNQDAMLALLR